MLYKTGLENNISLFLTDNQFVEKIAKFYGAIVVLVSHQL